MFALQLVMYISLVVFFVGTVYKLIQIARMPLHIRWDLYPIPHEKGRGSYGGSYFEEVDWWTKPNNTSTVGELKAMGKEIFFIQSMYEHNRSLWVFSFPFHIGLYFSVGFVLMAFLGGALELGGLAVAPTGNVAGALVYYITIICALAGAALGTLGAIGLFFSRMGKRELRSSTVRTDYFNLVLIAAIFVTTIWTWLAADQSFAQLRAFTAGMISFSGVPSLPTIEVIFLALSSLFLLWLPMTHMTHFVGKYFTYHKVRWEDHPNLKGSKLEEAVTEALGYKITWSAPHIKSGGSWADAATASDTKEAKKDE